MGRFWAIALLVLMTPAGLLQAGGAKVIDKDFKVQGKLSTDDPKDEQRAGAMQTHVVKLKAGKVYQIHMASTAVDSYLRLLDDKGKQLEEDDDSGGNLDAEINFNCTKDGEYKIVCTTFAAGTYGDYTLTVKINGAAREPTGSHTQLLGKPAPNFQPDFAINGKPASLSSFNGKVVLLYFWEPRSTSSIAMLPLLDQWYKKYKANGLVIVGVTFYPSEINQSLALDKETGKLLPAKTTDLKSDQAMLTEFALHKKIDHLLLTLRRQSALAVFDAYAVNGVPQVVLIDRKGIVRLIDVGGEKSGATVETQLKKLLDEK